MVAVKSIEKMTTPQLQDHLAEIEQLIAQRSRDAKQELVARLKEEAAEAGFDITELFGGVKSKGSKSKAAPKYRCPKTGQTWSGRGRKSNWIVAYEEEGHDIEEFAI